MARGDISQKANASSTIFYHWAYFRHSQTKQLYVIIINKKSIKYNEKTNILPNE